MEDARLLFARIAQKKIMAMIIFCIMEKLKFFQEERMMILVCTYRMTHLDI